MENQGFKLSATWPDRSWLPVQLLHIFGHIHASLAERKWESIHEALISLMGKEEAGHVPKYATDGLKPRQNNFANLIT